LTAKTNSVIKVDSTVVSKTPAINEVMLQCVPKAMGVYNSDAYEMASVNVESVTQTDTGVYRVILKRGWQYALSYGVVASIDSTATSKMANITCERVDGKTFDLFIRWEDNHLGKKVDAPFAFQVFGGTQV
jgi:hypothetical protein